MILTLEVRAPQGVKLLKRQRFGEEGGTIGRDAKSSWVLSDSEVSGRHARITFRNRVFYIEDNKSTNGISLNSLDNRLVPSRPYALKSGDRIFIRPYELDVSIAGDTSSPALRPLAGQSHDADTFRSDVPFSPGVSKSGPLADTADSDGIDGQELNIDPPTGGADPPTLADVLAGAGLEGGTVTPELASNFGQILRVVVSGLMDVLQARQQITEVFGLRATHFRPAENNPLRFSANADDALHNLLVKRNAAYLPPVEAFTDAFEVLRHHQLAMLEGMRMAFEAMLAEFDPDRLQEQFDQQLRKGSLIRIPARLRYWDLYRDFCKAIVKGKEANFFKLFGEEFARAYDEQFKCRSFDPFAPRVSIPEPLADTADSDGIDGQELNIDPLTDGAGPPTLADVLAGAGLEGGSLMEGYYRPSEIPPAPPAHEESDPFSIPVEYNPLAPDDPIVVPRPPDGGSGRSVESRDTGRITPSIPAPPRARKPAPEHYNPVAPDRLCDVAQPPEPALLVKRTPHMDLITPMPLRPGTSFVAKVFADGLASRLGETSKEIEVEVAAKSDRLDLEAWIAGTRHFAFPGARVKPFVIDLQQTNSQPSAVFDVHVLDDLTDVSGAQLVVNFTYCGRPCGQVSRDVTLEVETQVSQGLPASRSRRLAVKRQPVISVVAKATRPDLTIEITDPANSRQRFQCRISSEHIDEAQVGAPFDWLLNQQTEALVRSYMAEFVKAGISSQIRLENLRGAGRQLWEAAPKQFRDTFWKLVDAQKLGTILIVSEEPYIPWELMIPHRLGETRKPLGTEFAMGRWLPSDFVSPVQQLVLSRSLVVAPDYPGPRPKPLVYAAREAALVLKVVEGEQVKPAVETTFRGRVRASTADLIHFVCHGSDSESFGVQAICLEDCQLTSLQIVGMEAIENAFRARPVVFLNVCEIGRPSGGLVGLSGFVKAFIDLGASAVIAPLWSVRDSIAHDIANEFYTNLEEMGRIQPAEVFRKIRARAYFGVDPETAGEDTYAAYCFYGDPSALAILGSKGS